MSTTTTEAEIKTIIAALLAIHIRPFGQESGDPKYNAQRNLRGRTHYVDDETLRWHKSRVVGSSHHFGGLLFTVTCSDALDMHNTKRGFRVVVFDVFGTTVSRPKLEDASSTSKAAHKVLDGFEIDLVKHYREALADIRKRKLDDIRETEAALLMLGDKEPENQSVAA